MNDFAHHPACSSSVLAHFTPAVSYICTLDRPQDNGAAPVNAANAAAKAEQQPAKPSGARVYVNVYQYWVVFAQCSRVR